MKPETWAAVRRVFEAALQVPVASLPEFLESSCGGDEEVRSEVERLLRLDESAGSLDAPAVLLASGPPPSIGSRIGRFTILRVLGTGGMGTVFEATQDEPRRTVALKTLSLGIASPTRRARFQLEAEVLGSLGHPCIAQIFEAGTHEASGEVFPYFAMELIAGARAITHDAEARRLDVTERLRLFLDVCDAVQHGHQKGVIHRDLKPSNLLVDAEGRGKVIDFGIARVTSSDRAWAHGETQDGQLLGTLQYMSPEQLAGDPRQVDARTDVHALGVVLQELLSGTFPHDLRGLSLEETARRIRESSPFVPSTVPRDLRWIVLRAIEKDPARRYASVAQLAEDDRRFLAHEPVSAGPPSTRYRMAKLLRRHRWFLAAVGAVVLALSIGLVRAEQSARAEAAARREAARKSFLASSVGRFLKRTLNSVSPGLEGEDARMTDVLKDASLAVARAEQVPAVRAILHSVIGASFDFVGRSADAEPHFAAAREITSAHLATNDPISLEVDAHRALHLSRTGRSAEAEALASERLPEVRVRQGLVDDVEMLFRNALFEAQFHLDHLEQARATCEAILLLLAPVEAADRRDLVSILTRLSLVESRLGSGRLRFAAEHAEKAVAIAGSIGDEGTYWLQRARSALADVRMLQERIAEAEDLRRESLAWCRTTLGEDHPETLKARTNHALSLLALGDLGGAYDGLVSIVVPIDARLGADSMDGLGVRANLSAVCRSLGANDEAARWASESADIAGRLLPARHRVRLRVRAILASAVLADGRPQEAERLLRELLPDAEAVFGKAEPFVLDVITELASAGAALGDRDCVEELARDLAERAPGDARRRATVESLRVGLHAPPPVESGGGAR